MEKLVKFLEKNVEWFAMAVGAIILLWVVWDYVLSKPVFTQLTPDGEALTPGVVDQHILEGPVQTLELAISNPNEPKIPVTAFDKVFKDIIANEGVKPVVLAGAWPASVPGKPLIVDDGLPPGPVGVNLVEALPKPPAPTFIAQSSGRSTVNEPTGRSDPKNPAIPVLAAADKQWWSAKFQVDTKALDEAFNDTNIPAGARAGTMFLQVEAVRQEVLPDGSYGPEVAVTPLANAVLEPFPAEGAPPVVVVPFFDWASKSTEDIIHPRFYEVLKGDPWLMPGFEPEKPVTPVVDPKVTEEEKKLRKQQEEQERRQRAQQRQQQQQQQQQQRQQPQRPNPYGPTRRPGGTGGIPGPGGSAPARPQAIDNEPRVQVAQARPGPSGGMPSGGMPGGGRYPGPGYPGGSYPGGGPGYAPRPVQQPVQPGMAPGPAGAFDPASIDNVEILIHDDHAEPGKSYRYKVRYKLRNPVYGAINAVKDQKLATDPAIISEWSTWTPTVTFPSRTSFWIASNGARQGSVRFEVFTWKDGEQKSNTVLASPGDVIGDAEFSTGWTLVDAVVDDRTESLVVILTDDAGRTVKRNWNTDKDDPAYKTLREEVEKAKPPADDNAAAAIGGR